MLGHQGCCGGSGTCEGNVAVREAVGLAIDVTCVIVGTLAVERSVVLFGWSSRSALAPATWMAYTMTAHFAYIVIAGTLSDKDTTQGIQAELRDDYLGST